MTLFSAASHRLEHFRLSRKRKNAPTPCFKAFPGTKPLHTSAGNALAFAVICLTFGTALASAAEEARSGRFLHEIIRTSQPHRDSLQQMLRKTQRLPPWVRNMITTPLYVSGASTAVTLEGKPFELFGACLVKLCPQSHMRLLFTPQGKLVSMRVVDEKMGEILIGEPDADALAQLSKPGI